MTASWGNFNRSALQVDAGLKGKCFLAEEFLSPKTVWRTGLAAVHRKQLQCRGDRSPSNRKYHSGALTDVGPVFLQCG